MVILWGIFNYSTNAFNERFKQALASLLSGHISYVWEYQTLKGISERKSAITRYYRTSSKVRYTRAPTIFPRPYKVTVEVMYIVGCWILVTSFVVLTRPSGGMLTPTQGKFDQKEIPVLLDLWSQLYIHTYLCVMGCIKTTFLPENQIDYSPNTYGVHFRIKDTNFVQFKKDSLEIGLIE